MLNDQTNKISQESSADCNREELGAGTRRDLAAKRPLTKPTTILPLIFDDFPANRR
jgi:hypothetical protein